MTTTRILNVAHDSVFSRRQFATQFQRDVVAFDEQLDAVFKSHERAVKALQAAQAASLKHAQAVAALVHELAPDAGAALMAFVDSAHDAAEHQQLVKSAALPALSGVRDGPLAAARRAYKAYERAAKDADDGKASSLPSAAPPAMAASGGLSITDASDVIAGVAAAAAASSSAAAAGAAIDGDLFAQARFDVAVDLDLVDVVRHCDVRDAVAQLLHAHVACAQRVLALAQPLEAAAQQLTHASRARREDAALEHAALLSAQINGWPGVTVSSAAAAATGQAVHHAGFLHVKQTTGVLRDWQRRYFVLHDDRLDFYRLSKDFAIVGSAPVMLLRATPRPSDARSHVFELATPNEQWLVAASTLAEQQMWIESLAARTAHLLESQSRGTDGGAAAEKRAALLAELRAVPGNDKCADCGAADPTWTSLNHGALVCVQCSGVHRSLSTAYSKVFSLTLDDLSAGSHALLRVVGNELANKALERSVPDGARVAASSEPAEHTNVGGTRGTADERIGRERFARDKYCNAAYVGDAAPIGAEQLCAAVDNADLLALISALARAHVDPALSRLVRGDEPVSADEHSLLHRAVAAGNVAIVELLLLNNVPADVAGADGVKPLHVAIKRGDAAVASALLDHRCFVDEQAVTLAEASLPAVLPDVRAALQRRLAEEKAKKEHAEHVAAAAAAEAERVALAAQQAALAAANGDSADSSWSAAAWKKLKSSAAPAPSPAQPPGASATTATTTTTTTTTAAAAAAAAAPATAVESDKPEKVESKSRFGKFTAGLAKRAAAVKEQAVQFRQQRSGEAQGATTATTLTPPASGSGSGATTPLTSSIEPEFQPQIEHEVNAKPAE